MIYYLSFLLLRLEKVNICIHYLSFCVASKRSNSSVVHIEQNDYFYLISLILTEIKMSGSEIRTNRPIVLTNFKEEYYPYFFHNASIEKGEVLYIVQKAKSVGQALAICATWKREKFNPTDETIEILYDVPYIKYLYNDNNDIIKGRNKYSSSRFRNTCL
jgi:hypothetical protein